MTRPGLDDRKKTLLPRALAAVCLSGLLHASGMLLLARVSLGWNSPARPTPMEVDLVTPPPPPPTPPTPKEIPRPPPTPVEARKVVLRQPKPNREPPPEKVVPAPPVEAQPIFGVTPESVAEGESEVAVPVGNTVMTEDRTVAPVPPAPLPAPTQGAGQGFAPIADESVTELPKVRREIKPTYPPMARRLGIEGSVMLRLGVDRTGAVKSVRIVKKAGYGLDEAALQAIWSFSFSPAKGARGEPVDATIPYEIHFKLSQAQ